MSEEMKRCVDCGRFYLSDKNHICDYESNKAWFREYKGQTTENHHLKIRLENQKKSIQGLLDKNAKLTLTNSRAEEVIRFYADEKSWGTFGPDWESGLNAWMNDDTEDHSIYGGKRAREYFKEKGETK